MTAKDFRLIIFTSLILSLICTGAWLWSIKANAPSADVMKEYGKMVGVFSKDSTVSEITSDLSIEIRTEIMPESEYTEAEVTEIISVKSPAEFKGIIEIEYPAKIKGGRLTIKSEFRKIRYRLAKKTTIALVLVSTFSCFSILFSALKTRAKK